MTRCKWEDKSHKLCVGWCDNGCWRESQSTFKEDTLAEVTLDECILSTPDTPKVCVSSPTHSCEHHCQRMLQAVKQKEERNDVIREYERLVKLYQIADGEFELHSDTEDLEEFNHFWRLLEKAHMHMVAYRATHKITSAELKAFHGVKVASSVGDAIRILGGN